MSDAPTVLVVGGGATGTAVARDLAMRGAEVRLVERGGLAGETTGHSHGLLHSGARYAESDPAGAKECLAENEVLREIAPACVEPTGGAFVQLEGDAPDYVDEKVGACRDLGIGIDPLDVDAFRDREPAVSGAVERAFSVPDGVVYPGRLTAAQADDAAAHGAEISTRTALVDLEVKYGTVETAILAGRSHGREHVAVDHVVNATGAWADRVARLAGATAPMRPTRGVMVAVEGPDLGPVLNRCRPPADGDIVVPSRGALVCGTTSVPVEDPEDFERPDAEVKTVRRECSAMVPAVADRPIREVYWGLRPLPEPEVGGADGGAVGDARAISRDFTLLEHGDRDGVDGLTTIVGGKLTTCRAMAEAVGDHLAERLPIGRESGTASTRLRAGDDPSALDSLLKRYDVDAPTG